MGSEETGVKWDAATLLASIVTSSDDAIVAQGLGGWVWSWNRSAERIYGYRAEEMIGQHISKLAAPGRLDEIPGIVERFGRGERVDRFETVRLRKDGERISVSMGVSPIRNEQGELVGVSTISREIAEQDFVDRLLTDGGVIQSQLTELDTLYDTAPVGLCFLDLEHRYVRVNRRLAEINGLPPENHIGRRVHDVLADEIVQPMLDRVIATGEPVRELEVERRTPGGGPRHLTLNYYPARDATGRTIGVSGVVQDVKDQKRVGAQVRQANLRVEMLLASMRDPFLMLDQKGRLEYLNDPAAELLGQPREALLGREISSVSPEMSRVLSEPPQAGDPVRSEIFFDRLNAWFERLAHSSGEGVAVLLRDITAWKQSDRQRRESESIYRAIGESIEYGVWICDSEGRNLYTSESFRKLIGFDQAECAGFGWTRALRPEASAACIDRWMACVREGRPFDAELWFRGVDRSWRPILSRGVPVRDDAGKIHAWAGIHLDIQAFKDAQQELESINQELERTNQELEEFTYAAGHDLQDPLRLIRLMAHVLARSSELDEDGRACLSAIQTSTLRMSDLIRDLLEYSRVPHGPAPPTEPADLNLALELATNTCQGEIQESGCQLTVQRLPTARIEINQLARVFQNLISNAIKYRRGIPPTIEVTVDSRGSEWRIGVADNGLGIPEEQHEIVFLPFRRLHGPEVPGSGIGLAVCKKIVERHGGRIWVESEPGEGSLFLFTLPMD